jgi:hypothetical protein
LASQPSVQAEARGRRDAQAPARQSWSAVHLVAQQPQLSGSPPSSSSRLAAPAGSANEGAGPGVRADVVETVVGELAQAARSTAKKVMLELVAVMRITCSKAHARGSRSAAQPWSRQKTPATRSPRPPLIGDSDADMALLLRPGQAPGQA